MTKEAPYLSFSEKRPNAASLLFKTAAEKNTEIMRTKTPEEHREIILRRSEIRPVFPGVRTEPVNCDGVECEWIVHGEPQGCNVILYLHGGSWMTGNLKTAQMAGVLLAEGFNGKVLVADYRLSPEHPFPAGLEDCAAVFDWLLQNGYNEENIALFGDSAGGNLSLALMCRLKSQNRKLPQGAGLASPVPDLTLQSEIIKSGANLIYTRFADGETDIFSLYACENDRENPLISPICGDLTGFPPILIHAGGDEPLSVDCLAFAKKAYAQDVAVELKIFKGMFHDFSIVGVSLKESRDSMKEFSEFYRGIFAQGKQE